MALLAIAQHFGRPGTPTDQAWIESLFGHVKTDWPHLDRMDHPAVLRAELERVHHDYNTRRLPAIGYVTPDDEHEGRGCGDSTGARRRPRRRPQEAHRVSSPKASERPAAGVPGCGLITAGSVALRQTHLTAPHAQD